MARSRKELGLRVTLPVDAGAGELRTGAQSLGVNLRVMLKQMPVRARARALRNARRCRGEVNACEPTNNEQRETVSRCEPNGEE